MGSGNGEREMVKRKTRALVIPAPAEKNQREAGSSLNSALRRWEERKPGRRTEKTGTSSTSRAPSLPAVVDLGWSEAEALETRSRLSSFAEDWEAPGMEQYDDL
jgi:hypothetical protein